MGPGRLGVMETCLRRGRFTDEPGDQDIDIETVVEMDVSGPPERFFQNPRKKLLNQEEAEEHS